MKRQEKSLEIAELGKIFSSYSSIVVAHYKGINVSQIGDLRKKLREAGGFVRVIKNRLAKIAIQDTELQGMSDFFSGQSLIVCSKDPVVAFKFSVDFAKSNDQFAIIGGVLDKSILDKDSINDIASTPGIDVLRARILGCIRHSSIKLVRTLNTSQARILHVIPACVEENRQD